jgi:cytochrome c551/c552
MRPRVILAFVIAALVAFAIAASACGGGSEPPVSPVPDLPFQGDIDLNGVDATLATQGQEIFTTRCTTCHKMDERYVGPALGDVLTRRQPEWVMNMILAPEKMLQGDPQAQAVFAEYNVPMTNQNLTEAEARAIVEYLHQVNSGS